MKNKRVFSNINAALYLINGLLCVAFSKDIVKVLPYLCGGVLVLSGIVKFIKGIRDKDYASLEQVGMERSIVTIAVGIGVLIHSEYSLALIGMFWGMHGLSNGVDYLNIALFQKTNKDKYIGKLVHAIIEMSLALVLLFDPFQKIQEHIVILGFEIILESFDAFKEMRD